MKKSFWIIAAMAGVLFTACENGDRDFPDFKYSAVYFAYQSPIRTITLGEDPSVDNSLDNEHKCQIMATIAGVYENKKKCGDWYPGRQFVVRWLHFRKHKR